LNGLQLYPASGKRVVRVAQKTSLATLFFLSLLIAPVTERLSKIKNVTNDKNARNTFTVKCKGIP
jgi:hypothetical protein